MATTQALVAVLKAELKAAGITYAQLARALGLAESSVKRMFAAGDMPLSRIDAVCAVLGTDFAALARQVAAQQPEPHLLTAEQEAAVVADPKLLLVALCALSQWTLPQMLAVYRITEAEVIARLAQLDRLGVIELKPHNRYRLHRTKTLRWRPDGPVMRYFRAQVVGDYFSGGFDGEHEQLLLVHGQIDRAQAARFDAALRRITDDFAQQHLADQPLPPERKRPYTLLLGMRGWLFAALREFRRDGGATVAPGSVAPARPSRRPSPVRPRG